MIAMKDWLQSALKGGFFFLSITLQGAEVSRLNTEKEQTFPEIMETAKKVEDLKKVIAAAYKEITLLYHTIGKHMLEFEAKRQWSCRKVLAQLTKDLQLGFPKLKGFNMRNLHYMRVFAKEYQDKAVVRDVVKQLSWAHIETILGRIREKDHQMFYIRKAIEHGWPRATLVKHIRLGLHNNEDNLAIEQAKRQ